MKRTILSALVGLVALSFGAAVSGQPFLLQE